MKTLYRWEARRAGGRITITHTNPDGTSGKVAGVDRIKSAGYSGPETGHGLVPVAIDKDGNEYALS